MSRLIDLLRTHAVHQQLQALGLVIDAAVRKLDRNTETCLGVQRLRAVLAWCGRQIAAADPFLVELRVVDSVQARLAAILAEIAALIDDGHIEHLTRAISLVDDLAVQLVPIAAALAPEETAA
jgi:hypothetical protein